MNHAVGTEIDATAKWLEEHTASGAATLLRRVARQRDQARAESAAEQMGNRYPLAWRSARRRAREATRNVALIAVRWHDFHQDQTRIHAMLRTDLARFQVLAERAGWVPDPETRRLWRWREGWWELAFRKKNPKDGYHDSGWYLWGPVQSYSGEWVARRKADAMTEADRLITQHLAADAEVKQ